MRTTSLVAALAALPACAALQAEPVAYQLDPVRTVVRFEVPRFGASAIRGRFSRPSGTILIDRASGRGHVGLSLPTASVETGSPSLDERLRRSDMLASEDHPDAYFVAEGFVLDDAAPPAEIPGAFTLRGTSRPMSLKVLRFACRTDPLSRRETCEGDFEAMFRRSDFGARFGVPFVGDRVKLLVAMEAVRQE